MHNNISLLIVFLFSLLNYFKKVLFFLCALFSGFSAFLHGQNSLTVIPVGSGNVTGTGNFAHGNLVEIEAIPSTGFKFVGWSGDLAGKENPYSFEIKSSINAFAHFQKIKNEIIYINGQPAVAGSFVAKLNENGNRSLRRRINRVGQTTVYRRKKILDDLVKIEWNIDPRLSEKMDDSNVTSENLDQFSSKASKVKSSGVRREIKDMLSSNLYEFVEPNWVIKSFTSPSDNFCINKGAHWGLRNTGQDDLFLQFSNVLKTGIVGFDIEADEAWEILGSKEGPIIAVIDSGVDYNHQDLKPVMWVNENEIPGNKLDDDNNGYIDDIHGINTNQRINFIGDPMDANGHGTHVAGTIAASNITIGLAWNSKIMALRFMDSEGIGSLDDSVDCIDYAISMGAKVINASYGSYAVNPQQRKLEIEAIRKAQAKGVIFVAAAGNDGQNNDLINTFTVHSKEGSRQVTGRAYPASHELDNLISVAAVDSNGDLAEFSNYGSTNVDLGAPGVHILAPFTNHGWTWLDGTSMAAPFVSAAAALLLTMEPDLTPAEVRQRIISNVTPLESLKGKTVSGGMLNAHHVLAPPPAVPMVLDVSYSPQVPETGEPMDLEVLVTGPDPILGATVTATMGKLEQYSLFDNGGGIDKLAGDGIYSIQAYAPELASFDLNISVTAPDRDPVEKVFTISTITRPGNDDFLDALPLDPSLTSTSGSNIDATVEEDETFFESAISQTVWYSWQPTQAGDARLSTFGSSFDTTLAVYQGSKLGTLQLIGSNDDASDEQLGSEVVFSAEKDALYYLQIGGKLGVSGEIVINHPEPEEPEPEILPPVILTEFIKATRVAGEEYSIEAEVAGTEPFTFRWFKDGRVLPQSKQQNLYLVDLEVADSGRYSLQVSNDADVANARMLDLVVEPKLEISLHPSILPRLPERLKTFSIEVRAQTDIGSLLGATLEASIDESTPISLLDDGTGPDQVAGDGVYSASATAPDAPSFVLSISASASGTEPARIVRTFETIQRPPNDAFAGAILLDNKKHITAADNSLATTEQSEPLFLDELSNTLWFRWEPETEGTARISTKGSSPDTTLAIFTGTSIDALSQVASNDNFQVQARHAEVVFKAISGTSYLIQVGSKSGNGGKLRLHHPAPKKDEPKLIPPRIVTRPSELSKTEGEHLSISVDATGSAPLSYQWYVNNRIIPEARRSSYMIKQLSIKDSGIYSVRVSNKAGGTNAPLYNVTVRPSRESAPNDMVENAQPIAGSRTRFSTITRNATGQRGEPNHAGVSTPLHSVWWKWKAQKSGQVKLSTAGSSFDTTLSAYRLLEGSETDNRRADDPGQQIASFTSPTSTNDLSVTVPGHGFTIGQVVEITGVVGHSSESAKFLISSVKGDSFSLSGTANMDGLSLTPESRAKIIK